MGKFYCSIFPTTATNLFVIPAKANLFGLMQEQPPDNRALQNPIPYWTMHKTCSIVSLFRQNPIQILSRPGPQA